MVKNYRKTLNLKQKSNAKNTQEHQRHQSKES